MVLRYLFTESKSTAFFGNIFILQKTALKNAVLICIVYCGDQIYYLQITLLIFLISVSFIMGEYP